MSYTEHILFYDGHCNLCHRVVRFVAKRDKKRIFAFAPLQGETAAERLPKEILGADTVVLMDGASIYVKSRAVFRVMKLLGWPWILFCFLMILPTFFSNKIYDIIAAGRYKIWGRSDQCEIIPEIHYSRMLK